MHRERALEGCILECESLAVAHHRDVRGHVPAQVARIGAVQVGHERGRQERHEWRRIGVHVRDDRDVVGDVRGVCIDRDQADLGQIVSASSGRAVSELRDEMRRRAFELELGVASAATGERVAMPA